MRPPLDPRFGQIVARLQHAPQDSRAGLHRHASQIAAGCGRAFAEALAELTGQEAAGLPQEPASAHGRLLPQPKQSETPPTGRFEASGAISKRVVDRLRADPNIGTRQLAREIGCAATLVVRARHRLGLPSPYRVHTGARQP